MFDESFYVVDMEDASEDDIQDVKMLVMSIFSPSFADGDHGKPLSRRRSNQQEVMDSLETLSPQSPSSKLFDENSILNVRRADRLFSKMGLRDMFIKECIKRLPERRQLIVMNYENFANLSISLKSAINSSR